MKKNPPPMQKSWENPSETLKKPSVVSFQTMRRSKIICQSGTKVTIIQCFPSVGVCWSKPFFCDSKKSRNPETQLQFGATQFKDHFWWYPGYPLILMAIGKSQKAIMRSICKRMMIYGIRSSHCDCGFLVMGRT